MSPRSNLHNFQYTAPAGAVPHTESAGQGLRVHIHPPSGKEEAPYYLSGSPFEITAEELPGLPGEQVTGHQGVAVNHFSEPITITVSYSDTQIRGDESTLKLFYFDETWGSWAEVPSWADIQTNVITARVDHLTNFDISTEDWEAARLPNLEAFQVSGFVGSSQYAFPLQVPAGPGGLQPNLALNYSSLTVDNATGFTQGSWVGMGWSLETGYIQRDQHGSPNTLNDDTFTLNLNGASYRLLKGTDGYYHTTTESFLRIKQVIISDPLQGDNDDDSYWIVWDQSGTRYYFGEASADPNYSNRAGYLAYDFCYDPDYNPNATPPTNGPRPMEPYNLRKVVWRWSLNRVRNVFDQELTYRNRSEGRTITSICDENWSWTATDNAAYPVDITYSNQRYRLAFVTQQDDIANPLYRKDWDHWWAYGPSVQTQFMRSRLKEIQIQFDANSNGNFGDDPLVRKYVLNYASDLGTASIFPNWTWNKGGKTLTLTRIDEYGYNGAGPLPATSFTYGDNMHLTQANNGYGGQVAFEYERWYETQTEDPAQLNQSFGYPSDLCYSDEGSEGGWGGHCLWEWVNYEKRGTELRIDLLGGRGIQPGQFRPAGVYQLSAQIKDGCYKNGQDCGNYVNLGLYDGQNTQYAAAAWISDYAFSWVDATLVLPGNATMNSSAVSQYRINCEACDLKTFKANLLPGYFRVTQKTITDQVTSQSSTITYRYDDPATNDATHSTAVATTSQYTRYQPAYSEFRGHAMLQETTPDGLTTTTFFHQDDNRAGSPSTSLVYQRTWFDALESLTADWWAGGSAAVVERVGGDNAVKVSNPATNWSVEYDRSGAGAWELQSGKSAIFQFRLGSVAANSLAAFMVDTGTFGQSSYHQWGIKAVNGGLYGYRCDTNNTSCTTQGTPFLSGMTANRWYVAIITLDDTNGFLAQAWERDAAAPTLGQYREVIPVAWPHGVAWKFVTRANNATFWLDEYSAGRLYSLSVSLYNESVADGQILVDSTALPQRSGGRYDELKLVWPRLTHSKTLVFGGDSSWVGTMVEYQYNRDEQNNTQYGNQTRTIQSAWDPTLNSGQGGWKAYRATRSRFYPYTTAGTLGNNYTDARYLVGLPANVNTFKCADADTTCSTLPVSNLTSSTLYIYDDNSAFSQSPSNGVLKKQRTLLYCLSGNCSAAANRYYSDSAFGYDVYGNPTTSIVYTDATVETSFGAGQSRLTETVYDSLYHTYPVEIRNPRYAQGFPATTLNYAGTLNPSTTATGYTLGVPVSITNANGATNKAEYDVYGRMIAVYRPNVTNPTTTELVYEIIYHDTAQPFWTEVRQKTGTGAGEYITVRKFYNGLGQRLQVQQAGVQLAAGSRDIVVDTYYDSAGRAFRQSVPYDIALGSGYNASEHNTHNLGTWGTTTTYDWFGRPQTITAPDQSSQGYTYGDGYLTRGTQTLGYQLTCVEDALHHQTCSYTDAWGRTIVVDPPQGPTIGYEFDTLDQLTQVMQGDTISTTISYDLSGRKLEMTDPDMGHWTYSYDALGNLTRQTDALLQTTCLYYDALNRLTGKQYRSDQNCASGSPVINYYFDEGGAAAWAWGMPTRMTDNQGGSSTWTYDARGRMVSETKVIGGVTGSFRTEWGYTIADAVAWMKYPAGNTGATGEKLTYTYYPQGALQSILSDLGTPGSSDDLYYVQQQAYDPAGRLDYQYRGASSLAALPTVTTDYTYNNWQTQGGALQRIATTTSLTFNDLFSASPLDSRWESYIPQSGPTTSLTARSGWLRISVPNSAAFDHSTTQDKAPQVRTQSNLQSTISGDWSIETKANLSTYTSGANFHAGLMVYFSQYDAIYWGFNKGTDLKATRTGSSDSISVTNTATTVWLRVRKSGTTYTFEYKTSEAGAWVAAGTKVWTGTPTRVGMIVKTWSAVATTADFDYFSLLGGLQQDMSYTYDAVGNVTMIQDYNLTNGAQTQAFTYDAINRLDSAYATNGLAGTYGSSQYPEEYDYNAAGNLSSKAGFNYTYNAQVTCTVNGQARSRTLVHAVSAMGSNSYAYDCNGNMITRNVGGQSYTLIYDTESRLVEAQKNGASVAKFTYDAAGARVKAEQGGVTTAFVGGYYEWTGSAATAKKYYYAGGQRVALRDGSTLYWISSDQLGSTSGVLNADGTQTSVQGYKPWGETRYTQGTMPTKYQYTGQYSYATSATNDFGLMYYNARWYDPQLGRFAQADTLIPGASDPQSWDRYAYVNNSPLNYSDPSGHGKYCGDDYDIGCLDSKQANAYLAMVEKLSTPQSTNKDSLGTIGVNKIGGDHSCYYGTEPGCGGNFAKAWELAGHDPDIYAAWVELYTLPEGREYAMFIVENNITMEWDTEGMCPAGTSCRLGGRLDDGKRTFSTGILLPLSVGQGKYKTAQIAATLAHESYHSMQTAYFNSLQEEYEAYFVQWRIAKLLAPNATQNLNFEGYPNPFETQLTEEVIRDWLKNNLPQGNEIYRGYTVFKTFPSTK